MTAAAPDLREQMARARYESARKAFTDWPTWYAAPVLVRNQYRKEQDALLPVVTAHVAAERERAVAEVVERLSSELDVLGDHHEETLNEFDDGFCEGVREAERYVRAALPAQPADQAQETDR